MLTLPRILNMRIARDAKVAGIAQIATFIAAPLVMILGVRGTVRFATTEFEVFLGVLASGGLALLLVILGLLLPLGYKKTQE